jgi:hypothetical protein
MLPLNTRYDKPTLRNLVTKRSADSPESFADTVRVAQRTPHAPAEFCMRTAPLFESLLFDQILLHVRAFSREKLHDFERRRCAISSPNAALTRPRASPTPCVLRSARHTPRPSFACALPPKSNKICSTFARFFREKLRDFVRRYREIW